MVRASGFAAVLATVCLSSHPSVGFGLLAVWGAHKAALNGHAHTHSLLWQIPRRDDGWIVWWGVFNCVRNRRTVL